MKKLLPVFRSGRYAQTVGMVPEGRITNDHIREIAENTNRAMAETKWRPRIKLGHGDGKPTVGWINGPLAFSRGRLLAALEFNEDGKREIQSQRSRYVSAEIDMGKSLFGDLDSDRLGLRLGAVAMLPDSDPQVKDLVDLYTEAEFAEELDVPIASFKEYETREGEFATAYFAEVDFTDADTPEGATEVHVTEAQFKEMQEENAALKAKLAEAERAQNRASFAETTKGLKRITDDAVKAKKLGTDGAKFLLSALVAAITPAEQRAEFSDVMEAEGVVAFTEAEAQKLVDSLGVIVPTKPLGDSAADFEDEPTGVSKADFADMVTNAEAAKRVNTALAKRREKDPNYTLAKLQADIAGN